MKKRRTKAQIAATKKLVAFNKKRRGKKTVKKKGRKKRRTTKQIAATKKLVALNKRRGRNPCGKKVVRRANPKRKKAATRKDWLVFRCKGSVVQWLETIWHSRGKVEPVWRKEYKMAATVHFLSQKSAAKAARAVTKKDGWQYGVVRQGTTKAQIAAACQGKT